MRFHPLLACLAANSAMNNQGPSSHTTTCIPCSSFWNDDSKVSELEDPPPEEIRKEIRDRPWKGGFEPVPKSGIDLHDAKIIEGRIPTDLEGKLFRNGPGRIRIGNNRYGHWFDGDGLVTSLCVNGKTQRATYAAKYVETERFVAQRQQDSKYHHQRKDSDDDCDDDCGFASAGAWTKRGKNGGRFWENLFAIPTNPSNTNVLYLEDSNNDGKSNGETNFPGGGIYALAEGGPPVEMNPLTLETIGERPFRSKSGEASRSFFSAHYKKDPHTGDIYNHGLVLLPKPMVNVMKLDASGNLIRQQTSDLPMLSFVHDNALSENYFVLLVQPYEAPFSALVESVMGGEPLGKRFRWNNKNEGQQQQQHQRNETIAMIYSKETLERVAEVPLPLMSTYHHLDAFEDDCEDDDGNATTGRVLKFRTLAHDPPESRIEVETAFSDLYSAPSVPRCRTILEYMIDPKTSRLLSSRKIATDATPCELPDRNWGWGYCTKYVYTNAGEDGVEWANSLEKVDLETGECSGVVSFGEGVYSGAPNFFPRSDDDDANSEDDGYVFTQLYNSNDHSTDVCILDAVSMEKLAVLRLAKPVPFQFHGTWVPGSWEE
jgi:all-trans-8'-apo-beta-carotenal 15,15'-oxygenase